MSSVETRDQGHRGRQGQRHRTLRRFPRGQLRKIFFFAMLIAVSLGAGYVISRYESTPPGQRD